MSRDDQGLEWFCCDAHVAPGTAVTLSSWRKAHGLSPAAASTSASSPATPAEDDVLGPDTPRRAFNLLESLVESGEATADELELYRRKKADIHQRTHGADAAWYPTADPLMLWHLRTAEDGDRQVLRTRQTADLVRELEQNQEHVDMLKRRNAWIAVELRARAEAEEESP